MHSIIEHVSGLRLSGGTVHMSSVRLPSNSTNFILDCLRLESHDTIIDHQIVWKRNGEVFHDTGVAEVSNCIAH